MSKIYHYYFSILNAKIKPSLLLKVEPYTEERTITGGCMYRVSTTNSVIKIRKGDLGQVHSGRSIFLLERDDDKAMEIYMKYTDKKIQKLEKEIKKLNDIKTTVEEIGKFTEQ
jgi:hypothetical protein